MRANVSRPRPARTAGFTLIEIMVVVAIIGLLATLMAPKVMNALRRSKVTVTTAKLKGLKQPIQSYQMIHSKIPESLDELLVEDEMNMNEAYLESRDDFTDAWGNEFQYERMSNTKYDLISLGADGMEGGEADEQDIHLLDQSSDGGN
jgi:general secretion pathway protein G